ncbi:MAG: VCBS repeat-containing protein, partial [Gemmatimonadales bacterium]|nr:VCBS repeat-containing protein [Gemmatimonadales bacterium]
MSLTRAAPFAVLLLAACGPAPQAVPVPAPTAGARFVASVTPFPVHDTAGTPVALPFLGGWNTPRPQLHDVDRDGRLDLLVQDQSGRVVLLANRGAGPDGVPAFALVEERWAGLDVGEWSRVVNLDGDATPEVFAERPFSYIRLWRHGAAGWVASDTLRDAAGVAIFSDRQNIPQFVDLDCNGHLDLLIGRVAGTIIHYEADGARDGVPVFRLVTERFQDLEIVTGQGSRHGANTMAFVDADGDGDLDLLWGDFFEAGLLLFENAGSCAAPQLRREGVRFPRADPVLTSGYNAPAVGDLDGDGRPDLVVGVIGGAYDP